MKKWIVGLFLFNLASCCHANSVDFFLTGGVGISQINNKTSVAINDFIVNNYVTNTSTNTEPFYGIGAGYTFSKLNQQPIDLSLNLAAYYTYFGTINGTEYPFANGGNFDTLNYAFKARGFAAMLEPRFAYSRFSWQPYILLGAGSGWTHLYSYSEIPTDPSGAAAAAPIGYHNKTLNNFAYEAGLGIQKRFYIDPQGHSYFVSFDYRYMDFGKSELGGFPAKTARGTFHVNDLASQALALSLKIAI